MAENNVLKALQKLEMSTIAIPVVIMNINLILCKKIKNKVIMFLVKE
jgi:hypothetical protein